jgi:YD repeat-containing protein
MGRLSTLTEQNASLSVIGGTAYGPANELTGISTGGTGGWGGETRTYNGLKQLTSIVSSGVNMQYHYPSTANNGKIDYQIDNNLSAEQVNYTYDSLNRLIAAAVSGGWNQGFTYDGFGNLTAVSGTGSFSTSYNSSNQVPTCTDANGNSSSLASGCSYYYMNNYEIENRISMTAPGSPGGKVYYSYAPGNKRVWRGSWTGSIGSYTPAIDEVTFYSVSGQKLASYQITFMQGCCVGS